MRDITLEDTFRHQFTTRAFATGIPTTLSGTPALSVLEENNATPITSGVSVSVDRASVSGLNEATIVATAANGYENGKSYAIYISTGTVGGVSVVGEVVGHFTIGLSAAAVDLANGTDGLGAIKTDTAAILTDTGTTIPATITTAQNDLDTITGSDGVTLATTQANYAPAKAGDSMDVLSISGDSVAADNLEALMDGTGYSDPTAPSSRSQVDNIGAASGGSVNIEATEDNTGGAIDPSSALHVGSVQSGTFASTEAEDGTLHDIDDTGNDIDIVYGFSVGGTRTGTNVTFAGFVQGINDEIKVKAYDHVGADWEIIGTIAGQAGTDNVSQDLPLLLKHTGTGAELGKVYIRFETDSTTPSNLSVDKLLVSAVNTSTSIGYAQGGVWVDTVNGAAGTTAYVNGVADNPVNSWASAQTIASTIGVARYIIAAGSTITLDASSDSYELLGDNWMLALGGRSIDGAYFHGATVTGIGEATTTQPTFEHCSIGAATIPPAKMRDCGVGNASGTFTAAVGSGQYIMDGCYSEVPGSGSPAFDFSPVTGATGINNRGWKGGATYTLDSNCTLSHEVLAGGGTTITTAGADVEVRGITRSLALTMNGTETVQFVGVTGPVTLEGTTTATVNLYGVTGAVTDNTSAATVTEGGVPGDDIASILADTNELQTDNVPGLISALNDVSAADVNAQCDTAISDAALATAAALATVDANVDAILDDTGTSGVVVAGTLNVNATQISGSSTAADNLERGAIALVLGAASGTPSPTSIPTNLTEATDDHYNGRVITFTTGNLAGQTTDITDYTGSTKTLTVTALTEAPAATDQFVIS